LHYTEYFPSLNFPTLSNYRTPKIHVGGIFHFEIILPESMGILEWVDYTGNRSDCKISSYGESLIWADGKYPDSGGTGWK